MNHMKDKLTTKDKALIDKNEKLEELTKELKALEGIRTIQDEDHKEKVDKLIAKLQKSDGIIKR